MSSQPLPLQPKVWYRQRTVWQGVSAIIVAIGTYLCADTPDKAQLAGAVVNGILFILGRQLAKD